MAMVKSCLAGKWFKIFITSEYQTNKSRTTVILKRNISTVGARIPNEFGIQMVQGCSVLVPTIRKPNYTSLDHFIHKGKNINETQ